MRGRDRAIRLGGYVTIDRRLALSQLEEGTPATNLDRSMAARPHSLGDTHWPLLPAEGQRVGRRFVVRLRAFPALKRCSRRVSL